MAQLAERSAVNRQVLGSIPSGGVFFFLDIYEITTKNYKGTTGFEPVTAGSAIPCSTTELCTLELHSIFSDRNSLE